MTEVRGYTFNEGDRVITRVKRRAATIISPWSRDGNEDWTRVRWDDGSPDNTVHTHALEPLPANYDTLTESLGFVQDDIDTVDGQMGDIADEIRELNIKMLKLVEKKSELLTTKQSLERIRDGKGS